MPEQTKKILVTIGCECFEAEFQNSGPADDRDGSLDYFRLRDLAKDRGVRSVSLFQSGTDRVVIKDYDARIETVRLNVLRRAFDSGSFNFETTIPPHRYHELPLRATDFQPQKKASDETIRRFITIGAYYLGFKHAPNEPNFYVDFNCVEDLEYLGVKTEDIGRNVRLLTEEGYFRSSALFGGHLRVSPTSTLIRQFENGDAMSTKKRYAVGAKVLVKTPGIVGEVIKSNDAPTVIGEYWHTIKTENGQRDEPGCNLELIPLPLDNSERATSVSQTIHFYGANSRFNQNSTDNSINTVSVSSDRVFTQIREASSSVANKSERDEILLKLDELQRAQGSTTFLSAYQGFIAVIADHMTVFGPFIPALAQLLSGK